MEDTVVERYLKLLEKGQLNPIHLAGFYCELFNLDRKNKIVDQISIFCKIYPIQWVFMAMLDMTDMGREINFSGDYGMRLLGYFLKKRLEKNNREDDTKDLTNYAESLLSQFEARA